MRFLSKIMPVVVMLVAGLGCKAMVVSSEMEVRFPEGTPYYKGLVLSSKMSENKNRKQVPAEVQFIDKQRKTLLWRIPGYKQPTDVPIRHAVFTHIQIRKTPPVRGNINFYFPIDGRQPTTEEAAIWSCANVDDSAVTDWYMRMFGWVDPNTESEEGGVPDPLSMGFSPETQLSFPIITLYNHKKIAPELRPSEKNDMDNQETDVVNSENEKLSRRKAFWDTFRKIADKPVGRVLLYRLLIEIRRQEGEKGFPEYYDESSDDDSSDDETDKTLEKRNNARSLLIAYATKFDNWEYIDARKTNCGIIYCSFEKENKNSNKNRTYSSSIVIGEGTEMYTKRTTENFQVYCTTALFHEMLHWYQQLRDPRRGSIEYKNNISSIGNSDLVKDYGFYNIPIPYLSWGIWPYKRCIEIDELRVICGDRPERKGYLQGDDLSENAFRYSIKAGLRFGHGDAINTSELVVQDAVQRADQNALSCVQKITGGKDFKEGSYIKK